MGALRPFPWLQAAAAHESHRWVRYAMEESALLLQLASGNPAHQQQAAATLGTCESERRAGVTSLGTGGRWRVRDRRQKAVAQTATAAIERIESWNVWSSTIETLFRGISLSSILLIMSLGLAIVFGLMGSSTWRMAS